MSLSQELAGKVAVITGGAHGLGRATVELFVEQGAKVVIGDLDESAGVALAHELGGACKFLRADVSKADHVQALVDFAVKTFGGLHVMCNNAGVPNPMCRLLDDDLAQFERIINVNLLGVMRGTQIAARYMRDHGGGSIINTSSIAGVVASFGMTTYRASKAAVIHFTKNAAIDLAEYNIRVNCLVPGQIETKLLSDALSKDGDPEKLARFNAAVREIMDGYQPLQRRGQPLDVAKAALFLASAQSDYITGVVLPVDGGITAGDATKYFEKFENARKAVFLSN